MFEELTGLAEPGAFAAAEVDGHGGGFFEDFAGPLTGFGVASFRGEKGGEVEVSFGHGGGLGRLAEEGFGFFFLVGEGVGLGEQSLGAMEVVSGVLGDDAFEVGDGRCGVAHEDGTGSALVEGVDVGRGCAVAQAARALGSVAGGDGFVEGGAGLGETAFVHVEVPEFFEVADGGVDLDESFEFTDAFSARESAGRLAAEEVEVGSGFNEEIDKCAEGAEEEDDEDPVSVWTAADEMENGEGLEDDAPGEEEMA